MLNVARLPAQDRQDLFSEAAAQLGIRPTIVEKDFWVCLVLKALFEDSPFKEHLVFKGGTSLSKVFELIDRFSEDIDLVLDWKLLPFDHTGPPPPLPSKTQQDKFNKEANRQAAQFIRDKLCPTLNESLQQCATGLTAAVDPEDTQVVDVFYPAAFSETYIRPEVRLELGPLASSVPSAHYPVQPYAADLFPHAFTHPSCSVLTILAERTFWEKATILHQEAQRRDLIPKRHSRHYYDLFRLAQSPFKEQACHRIDLLADVVEFKQRYYPSQWARYDLALPGTLKLLPERDEQMSNLARDYQDMQVMFVGTPPSFEEIVRVLRELEHELNALK